MAPAQASLLAKLDTQERVRDFLTNAVASGRASHAYLFLGAPGAGKLDAAWALAQAFLCEQDGCGACDSCVRVARHTHPDVHYYTPESATGYLIAQTRELLDDVPLAPIRAKAKVYIIDRAEQLRANTANALLKTLEEPPEGVMFILLGTSVGATTSAEAFLNWTTIKIVALGLIAFAFGTAAGVVCGKIMCKLTHGKVNPLIGSAGVSAVPMAARVSQKVGAEADPTNFLLMHAMGPNVAGVIGTAVAAGTFLAMFGVS